MERRRRRGLALPELADEPPLYADLLPIWEAFWQLSASRSVGMAVEGLKPADICAWLIINGEPDDAWPGYYRWLMFMDGIYLAIVRERARKGGRKPPQAPDKGRADANALHRHRRSQRKEGRR